MNEQKILRNQLFKYIRSNLLIFINVFIVFGIFMAILVRNITLSSVEIELKENCHNIKKILRELDEFEIKSNDEEMDGLQEYNVLANITNPKILCIVRNDDGKILTTNASFMPNEAFEDFDFDDEKINKTYVVIFDDEYFYKGITIDLSDVTKSTTGYIQILLNIDAEREMIKEYQRIIIWSVIFGIGVSIIASINISRRSLAPVAKVLKQQEEFVQNVSHELRTPLTIIQAKQELLLSDPNAKIVDKLEDISVSLNETKRMSKMTKDLMTLSRGDSKQMELNKEEVEIDEFIESIGKTYREIVEIQEKIFSLDLNYKKVISIDTNKIYQVIVILLDNALKYTEPGDEITIKTYPKEGKCIIEVADTGIGINDEAIKHVFERFYRADNSRARETGGSGLGLSIADMLVSKHGGTIKASHNGEKGTIFTIKLPR